MQSLTQTPNPPAETFSPFYGSWRKNETCLSACEVSCGVKTAFPLILLQLLLILPLAELNKVKKVPTLIVCKTCKHWQTLLMLKNSFPPVGWISHAVNHLFLLFLFCVSCKQTLTDVSCCRIMLHFLRTCCWYIFTN